MSESAFHNRRRPPTVRERRQEITLRELGQEDGMQDFAEYLIETGRIYQ